LQNETLSMPEKHNEPHFCLLIPCYNNRDGLLQSLASIQYGAGAFLVVIVDDGSREPLQRNNIPPPPRASIQLITLPVNSGITVALNTGLEWVLANTNIAFIARLDCGDTCHMERFDRQIALLRNQPDVGLVGSWCTFRPVGGRASYTYKTPLHDDAIRRAMHLRNVFIHPAVMFRTNVLWKTGLYPDTFPGAEDYALFWMMLQTTQGAIIDQPLVTCALNPAGISAVNRSIQLKSCARIIRKFGTNTFLVWAGLLQTAVRRAIPSRLILHAKFLLTRLAQRKS
jgi:glycosyltransferase involved in cell wall biosynthesis